jgi:AcrR family transcriptional regulator
VTRRSTGNRPSDGQLLDAGCEVFGRLGFHAASMDAIAERAETTKPTLYAHFGGKNDLYEACLTREARKFREWLFATYDAVAELTVSEQVRADITAFFEYGTAHPSVFRLLFDERASGPGSSVRDELTLSISDRVADRFRAAHSRRGRRVPGASADLLAAMVVGIAIHGARHALLLQRVDADLAGELASSLAYAGMRHLDRHIMTSIDEHPGGRDA